jgi:hypothetical protein
MKRIKGGRGGIIVQAEKGETANPNGRPRKTINSVNKELEEQGIKPTTANEIKDIYLRLVNMEMTELKALVENQKQPALIRIVGKKILSEKGFDIIEKMLDRSLGKPNQSIDIGLTEDARKEIQSLFPTKEEINATIGKADKS